MITNKIKQLVELLLPAQCLVCALKANNKLICLHCENKILTQRTYCLHCALPLDKNADYCGDCLQKSYLFNHIHAVGEYNKPLSILIKQFKYQQQLVAGELLAELLVKSVLCRYTKQQLSAFDYLLAVPLHPKKLRQRGFNQSQIISNNLHKKLNIPLLENIITRTKETTAQEGLSIIQRNKNVLGAFTIYERSRQEISGKNIIIVDDVVTTCSTINSLCELLIEANSITIFCISRTSLPK